MIGGLLLITLLIYQALTGTEIQRVSAPPALSSPTGSEGSILLEGEPSWPEYPDTLPTFQILTYTALQQGAAAWALQQGLQPFGTSARTFSNTDRTQIMTITPGSQAITYTNSDLPLQTVVDQDLARRQLERFLENLGFSLKNFSVRTEFVSSDQVNPDTFTLTGSPNEAVAVRFYLTEMIDVYPLRWEAGSVEEFVFVVTNQGVISATIPYFPMTWENTSASRTFSEERVRENIKSGGYVIVGTIGAGADRGRLTSLTAERVTLEYRASTTTNAIEPFIRIQGSGVYADGQIFPTQIVSQLTP
jgi:hypothetical protein